MTLFPYDDTVPAANDDPSDDQPVMLSNGQQAALIWDVDHVGFNADDGGTHLQTTFSSKNAAGAQTDPKSVLYTGNGTASSVADLFFKNQNGTFRPNIIKAAGRIQCAAPVVGTVPVAAIVDPYNVVSATQTSLTKTVNITLTTNAAVGTICIPLISLEVGGIDRFVESSSLNANILTVVIRGSNLNTDCFINFAILQV